MIPELMAHRARVLGTRGHRWLNELPALLEEIESSWQIRIVQQLEGGTEALVYSVTRGSGTAVLKIALPGSLSKEALVLQLAEGRGYAKVYEFNPSWSALLLEHLGDHLAGSGLSISRQIEIICTTLKAAWRDIDNWTGLTTGAGKAKAQAEFINANWKILRPSCASEVKTLALDYALQREQAFNPLSSHLVHGDAHAWNTLAAPVPDAPDQHKFVDPDGLFAEPALDLAISLREWREDLLDGDALANGRQRCALLSELTGIDEQAIWQWALIEQVSCGLLDLQLDDQKNAAQHFRIAECWSTTAARFS